jgi:farnesyl diphosphate synthase
MKTATRVSDLQDWTAQVQRRVELALQRLLPPADLVPARLHQAMRYATLDGGKRVRPLLAFAAGEISAAPDGRLECVACALECIHAYSLVHDDMPCMDDDVLRRGKPTVHVHYDEATALLVGDALQSLAFEIVTHAGGAASTAQQLEMVHVLAAASGSRGMAGGQAIDLAAVGQQLSLAELETMHRLKTGALIAASVKLGALCGELLQASELDALDRYARAIGLAFQVVDDCLDAEAPTEALGKTAGKDAAQGKPTYVSILGLPRAKAMAESLRNEAHAALDRFEERGARLAALADFIVRRSH